MIVFIPLEKCWERCSGTILQPDFLKEELVIKYYQSKMAIEIGQWMARKLCLKIN